MSWKFDAISLSSFDLWEWKRVWSFDQTEKLSIKMWQLNFGKVNEVFVEQIANEYAIMNMFLALRATYTFKYLACGRLNGTI